MSGHSKWNNIKHKKEKTDAQRASLFTKIGREISMVVKAGGPDPVSNTRLALLIAKAKSNNVPNDNIDRIIKKAAGGNEADYENIVYEGYGPCGVAVIVDTLTDNRNRTAGDMRHYFDKFGGNLGQTGSVNWMFSKKGVIVYEKEELDEDMLMMDALDAGAEDIVSEDDVVTVYTDPNALPEVQSALAGKGYTSVSAEVEMVPGNFTRIDDEDSIKKMNNLLEMLEDNDDVQNVWHNWENADEE